MAAADSGNASDLSGTPEADRSERAGEAATPVPGRAFTYSSLIILVLLTTAAVTTSLIAKHVVVRQEKQLLNERAGDLEGVVTSAVQQTETAMISVASATGTAQDSSHAFQQAASPLIGPQTFATIAFVHVDAHGVPVVTMAVGSGLSKDQLLTGPSATAVQRALARPDALVATQTLIVGSDRRVGGAISTSSLSSGSVIYIERSLGPPVAPPQNAQFNDVKMVLFTGPTVTPNNVLFATTSDESLGHPIVTRKISIGGDPYTLAVAGRKDLIGGLASGFPMILLVTGLATAFLATLVMMILQHRRRYALALVRERTEALNETMQALRARAEIDNLLRRAAREISTADDLDSAMLSLYTLVHEIVPTDRVSLAVPEGEEMKRVASAGPAAGTLSPYVALESETVRTVLKSQSATIVNLEHEPKYHHGMKSVVAIPIFATGKATAMITVGSKEAAAYKPEDLPVLEALGREMSGVMNQLLSLERERDTARRFQQLDRLKSEFVGIVAHDLRSPMTVIAGFADLLLMDPPGTDEATRRDYLSRISKNVKRLAELVEDVLQVARIESGELKCESRPFDLATLLRRTARDMASAQNGRSVIVDISDEVPLAIGDEQRQWQVFTNLVSNAMKFSDAEMPVEVSLDHANGHLEITVRDHGCGMSEEDLPRIFDKFSRVSQPGNGAVTGTGLGLYIARSLVEAQGGEITVKSAVGEGSTFRYTVPAVVPTS